MKVLYLKTSALPARLFNDSAAEETIGKMNQTDLM